jgi:hypothetical protein
LDFDLSDKLNHQFMVDVSFVDSLQGREKSGFDVSKIPVKRTSL